MCNCVQRLLCAKTVSGATRNGSSELRANNRNKYSFDKLLHAQIIKQERLQRLFGKWTTKSKITIKIYKISYAAIARDSDYGSRNQKNPSILIVLTTFHTHTPCTLHIRNTSIDTVHSKLINESKAKKKLKFKSFQTKYRVRVWLQSGIYYVCRCKNGCTATVDIWNHLEIYFFSRKKYFSNWFKSLIVPKTSQSNQHIVS